MTYYYYIKVYQDSDDATEYDITTNKGDDMARLIAFLMDGGSGTEYEDDLGVMVLAKIHTEIVRKLPV